MFHALRFVPLSAVSASVLLLAGIAAAQNTHTIRRLTASGVAHGTAWGVDNQRNIVGELLNGSGLPQPVLWQNGVGSLLPVQTGGNQGSARSISDTGIIAGQSANTATPTSGTMWAPAGGGTFTTFDLGIAPNDIFSGAHRVNDNGQAAGFSDNGLFIQPVAWPDDASVGNPNLLPTTLAMTQGEGLDMSAAGVVSGYIASGSASLAARWTLGGGGWTLTTLATLGANSAWAVGEDSGGVVSGTAFSPTSGLFHVVRWSGASISDEGTISGMDSFANAVNAAGEVVGRARTNSSPPFVAFLSVPGAGVVDANTLLPAGTNWLVTDGNDIADDGVIVGGGNLNGFLEPFVMIPVSVTHSAPTPGVTGVNNTVTATGATPGATVFFFVALAGGETVISGCLEALDLASPAQLGSTIANGAGVAALSFFAPGSVSGIPLFFQAYDPAACHTSSVRPFTFP